MYSHLKKKKQPQHDIYTGVRGPISSDSTLRESVSQKLFIPVHLKCISINMTTGI